MIDSAIKIDSITGRNSLFILFGGTYGEVSDLVASLGARKRAVFRCFWIKDQRVHGA